MNNNFFDEDLSMKKFATEFTTLKYVLDHAQKILLVAHTRPDPDTAGAVLALKEYCVSLGKDIDIACHSPFPSFFESLIPDAFHNPSTLNLHS